jgi:hypothetical protein
MTIAVEGQVLALGHRNIWELRGQPRPIPLVGIVAKIDSEILFAPAADDIELPEGLGIGGDIRGLNEHLLANVPIELPIAEVVGRTEIDPQAPQSLEYLLELCRQLCVTELVRSGHVDTLLP